MARKQSTPIGKRAKATQIELEVRNKKVRATFTTLINSVKHDELMKKIPFYLLFRTVMDGKLVMASCKPKQSSILVVIENIRPAMRAVILGFEEANFVISDVKLLLGIMMETRVLIYSTGRKQNALLLEECFRGLVTSQ